MKETSISKSSYLSTQSGSTRILPPNAGKGRKVGTPNRIGSEVKDMILGALQAAGGEAYLAQQATLNPVAFMTLLSKILPRDNVSVTGDLLKVNVITGIDRN